MTVKELIEELEQCPQDKEVFFGYLDTGLQYREECIGDVSVRDGKVYLE